MQHTTRITTRSRTILADTFTPVSIYLQLRDEFPNSILLESSDYHGNENACSYICCEALADFVVERSTISYRLPGSESTCIPITARADVMQSFADFLAGFETDALQSPFMRNGVFGYMRYDAVQFCEDITLQAEQAPERDFALMRYHFYRFVIVLNHFTNELTITEHIPELVENGVNTGGTMDMDALESLIRRKTAPAYRFHTDGEEESNFTDGEFVELLERVKQHIYRGDVFQIVPSRRFTQGFKGDDFNVYRALRSINPSPYLFYFDYGSVRIFGSSPEAQIVVKGMRAEIHPIAGTFKRTGNDAVDAERATELLNDPKENAEHVMLVDLARNDLSRHCRNVRVEVYREVQYYSHVIHLVSKVTGELNMHNDSTNARLNNRRLESSLKVLADTFPAGTLSGAPKYMAMTLIDRYERGGRTYYGGAIGFIDFNGDINHAIMIRSFLSMNATLTFQAGCGLVAGSEPETELQEVRNKLGALRKALGVAETL
jgi:anthranilate synthase component I